MKADAEHKILCEKALSIMGPAPQWNQFSPVQEISLFIINILYNNPYVLSEEPSTVLNTRDSFLRSIPPAKAEDKLPRDIFKRICQRMLMFLFPFSHPFHLD